MVIRRQKIIKQMLPLEHSEAIKKRLWHAADTLRANSNYAQGGHDVPESVIRRRFSTGLHNFENSYRHCVDFWQHINNSSIMPILIEEGKNP